MTTTAFLRRAGPIAQAMNRAHQLSSEGKPTGTFACPKCGSQVRYTAIVAHKSSGACAAAGCIRWSNQ